jgi:hypothetical protein
MAVAMDGMLRKLDVRYQHFGRTCCLHLQDTLEIKPDISSETSLPTQLTNSYELSPL